MKKNLILLSIVIVLTVVPLFIQKGSDFSGADGKAKDAITEIDANYKPWFSNLWTPPGGETESLLFALQAAIGAGFIGYFIGYMRGKQTKNGRKEG